MNFARVFEDGILYVDLPLEEIPEPRHREHTHSDGDMQRLVGVIAEHGVITPILMSGADLVDGYARVEAARALGLDTIPAQVVESDNPDLLRLALSIATYARVDTTALADTVLRLASTHVDMDYSGLKPAILQRILEKREPTPRTKTCPKCGEKL